MSLPIGALALEFAAGPAGLLLLALAPILWLALFALDRVRARRLSDAVGSRVATIASERSTTRRALKRGIAAAATLLTAFALLGPTWGAPAPVESRGIDVVVCLDVSRSMLARDVEPDRLTRARHQVRALAERARGDRLGLVIFAGDARVRVPLTLDAAAFAAIVDGAGGPGEPEAVSVARGGSDLGGALAGALDAIEQGRASGHGDTPAVVVLVSDGEDLVGRGSAVATVCRERGVVVHCVGVGTALGGKIPIAGDGPDAATISFLRDRAGREVVTAMDAPALRAIAAATGGRFLDGSAASTASDGALASLYDERIAPMAAATARSDERRRRENRFQWPLLGAIVLWALDLGLSDRRRRGSGAARRAALPSTPRVAASAVGSAGGRSSGISSAALVLLAVGASLVGCGGPSAADAPFERALAALRAGDRATAELAVADVAREGGSRWEPVARFLRGNVAFARSEALEAEATKPGADATTLDRAITYAEDAAAAWRAASMTRDDWPAARHNVERALLTLARLRETRSEADRRAKKALVVPTPKPGEKPAPGANPDAPPPLPPPPSAAGSDPAAAPPPAVAANDLAPAQVLGLLDVLAEKEQQKVALRRARRLAPSPDGERDW